MALSSLSMVSWSRVFNDSSLLISDLYYFKVLLLDDKLCFTLLLLFCSFLETILLDVKSNFDFSIPRCPTYGKAIILFPKLSGITILFLFIKTPSFVIDSSFFNALYFESNSQII